MPAPRPPHRSTRAPLALLAAACAAALALAPAARADDDTPDPDPRPYRVQHPTAIRLGGTVLLVPWRGWTDTFAGLTVGRQVMNRLAVEGTVGAGGTPNHLGPHLGLAARATLFSNQRGAFTVALGTHAAFLSGLGTATFGRLEAAFELWKRGGFNMVAGGGVATPLNDSPRRRGVCGLLEDDPCHRYLFGDPALFGTFQAGMSF